MFHDSCLEEALRLPSLWQQGFTGKGVRVGHLDSGVTAEHVLLRDRISTFCQFDRFGDAVPGAHPTDQQGHGTHTAGIVAQVAPGVSLCSAQVIEGGYVVWRILRGIDWLLNQSVDIVVMPVGIKVRSPIFTTAINALKQQNILVVSAIGNGGAGRFHSPGWDPQVLSIGATDFEGKVAKFSGSCNHNNLCLKPDLVAPGIDILSAQSSESAPEELCRKSGTSMAAAAVAGVAALLMEACPLVAPDIMQKANFVEQALLNTYLPISEHQSHRVRLGQINAVAALKWMRLYGSSYQETQLSSPTTLSTSRIIDNYRDPRLTTCITTGNLLEHKAAICIAHKQTPIQSVIDRLASHHQPKVTQYLSQFNCALVLAKKSFLQALSAEPQINMMSLPDVDLWNN
ncbi:MAG: Subtilisin-like serine protease [Phormidesmis priestleyi Ana]|uniref:Subtilisin-like serine protease n=1 Tax=Phormidesmis priestleyi Ana TaxID=1666911 RepID=A0A0P7YPM9_9CYAN|nr:MAG: Subtilisin-like serine protease [Phormidesmis priestleyi Ana]